MKAGGDLRRPARFAAVGAVNTVMDVGVFALLHHALGLALLPANSLAYLMAAANSFALNKLWTFADTRHSGRLHRQFPLFLALDLLGLGLSNALVLALAQIVPALAAKLLSVGLLFLWNYTASKRLVFRGAPARK